MTMYLAGFASGLATGILLRAYLPGLAVRLFGDEDYPTNEGRER